MHFIIYEDGSAKNQINKDELQNISERMFVLGAAGSGKSAMLDSLLKNMYYKEHSQNNDKSDT